MELFGLIGSGIGGYQSTYQSSLIENLREEISLRSDLNSPDVGFVEIVGGNDNLPNALAQALHPTTLNLGAVVTRISRNTASAPARYTVTWMPTHTTLEVNEDTDFLVLAVPFTALRSVKVTPAWPVEKARAIRELHYQHASKVMLQFRQRWWNDPKGPLQVSTYEPYDRSKLLL